MQQLNSFTQFKRSAQLRVGMYLPIPTSISQTIRRSETREVVIENSHETILKHFFVKGHCSGYGQVTM